MAKKTPKYVSSDVVFPESVRYNLSRVIFQKELVADNLHREAGADKIYPLGPFRRPKISNFNPETREFKTTLLQREEDPQEYDRQLYYMENLLVVGGLGFAGMNPSFNANQGIYGIAVSREEELKRCEEWRTLYEKATEYAKKNHCSLVVLSHNPLSDWLDHPEKCSNCFAFSGHTHRNIAYGGENNTFVFADNQVGYSGKKFSFKKAALHLPRNPFASDPDGFRETNCTELKEYYHYVRETLPGTGAIENQIKNYEAKLYVLKQDGYVGFFLASPRGVFICNGGQIRKIGPLESLDHYMDNFMVVIQRYITAFIRVSGEENHRRRPKENGNAAVYSGWECSAAFDG